MEKGLKYPQSIQNGTKLPFIHLLAPKCPSHPPIGSKIPLSSTFWFKIDHLNIFLNTWRSTICYNLTYQCNLQINPIPTHY